MFPVFPTELVTSIAVYEGTSPGGGGLLPPVVLKVPPQTVGPAGTFENPLKLSGAGPPLTEFAALHCELQNVAVEPMAAFPSPITKLPPVVHWKTMTLSESDDGR